MEKQMYTHRCPCAHSLPVSVCGAFHIFVECNLVAHLWNHPHGMYDMHSTHLWYAKQLSICLSIQKHGMQLNPSQWEDLISSSFCIQNCGSLVPPVMKKFASWQTLVFSVLGINMMCMSRCIPTVHDLLSCFTLLWPRPWFNIKMPSYQYRKSPPNIKMLPYQYRNSHYKDKDCLTFIMGIPILVLILKSNASYVFTTSITDCSYNKLWCLWWQPSWYCATLNFELTNLNIITSSVDRATNSWQAPSCHGNRNMACIVNYRQITGQDVHVRERKHLWTRATRTPAFWGYPPPPHDYPHYWVMLDPKSKLGRMTLKI